MSEGDASADRHTIREWRELRFLTMKQLSERVHVHEQTIWNWEHGSVPALRHRKALVDALGVRPEQIIYQRYPKTERPAA